MYREDLVFAWRVCQSAVSNTVAIAMNGQLIGIGAGDPKRNQCCETAVRVCQRGRIAGRLTGSVAASDSYFPAPDGPKILIDAGVKAILHPGGSKEDEATVALCKERGVSLFYTSADPKVKMIRAFRH